MTEKRYKKMENRRIAQVQIANLADGEPQTILIRFTDGGTAQIDLEPYSEIPYLTIEVDGYA